jgi:hypothetical protein
LTFVDALDTTGFVGTVGSQNVFPSASEAASPVPITGTLSNFSVHTGTNVSGGPLVLTVFKNGVATSMACTIASGGSSCSDSSTTITVTTANTIAVRIENNSGNFVRNVAWTAQLS